MTRLTNVWNEVRVTSEGISISLLSENASGGAIVEDEAWFTFDELEEMGASQPLSLNLSDETSEILAEMRKNALKGKIYELDTSTEEEEKSYDTPTVGDIVKDQNAPDWSVDRSVKVVEVKDYRSDEYVIQENHFASDKTVADANPSEPDDAPVVVGKYRSGSSDEYAFPVTRLEW